VHAAIQQIARTDYPPDLPPGSYFAWGNGGEFLFVIPSDDLVIVHLAADGGYGSGVRLSEMATLLALILDVSAGR
jgi:CubicO group peptidase (beta-lactamase class C family)